MLASILLLASLPGVAKLPFQRIEDPVDIHTATR